MKRAIVLCSVVVVCASVGYFIPSFVHAAAQPLRCGKVNCASCCSTPGGGCCRLNVDYQILCVVQAPNTGCDMGGQQTCLGRLWEGGLCRENGVCDGTAAGKPCDSTNNCNYAGLLCRTPK
jgi:hypothetical protein